MKKILIINFILGLCSACIEYVFAFSVQDFFKHLEVLRDATSSFIFRTESFEISAFILVLVSFVRFSSESLKIYLSRLSQQLFCQSLRLKLINIALKYPARISSNRVVSLFSDETTRAGTAYLNLSSLTTHIVTTTIVGIILMLQFPRAFGLSIVLLIILYAPYRFLEKKMINGGPRLSEEWEKTNSILTSGIRNNFYLSVIGKINQEIKNAEFFLENYLHIYKKAFATLALKNAIPSLIGINIFVFIGYLFLSTNFLGQHFSLLTFFYLFLRFTQSLSAVATLNGDLKINIESTRRLADWFKNFENTSQKNEIYQPIEKNEEIHLIECKNLSFAYENNQIIKNMNFEIKKGEALLIKGPSGSGKSTLLSLLLGINASDAGEINFNKKSISDLKHLVSKQISYVGPQPFLIEGSFRDNLLYGNDHALSLMEINEVLSIVELKDLIQSLPLGLEAKLNELGSTISTGQKQRLMIARALLRKHSVLIMDEATANLDQRTESNIINKIFKRLQGKILIIVSHKDSFESYVHKTINLREFD